MAPLPETYTTSDAGLKLLHAHLTDVGQRRQQNEDATGFFPAPGETGTYLMVVADGVGGNNAGEVASALAVENVSREFFAAGDPPDIGPTLLAAMQTANDVIVTEAAADPRQAGMATTCTCAVIRGETVVIGHVGDCRAYMALDGQLVRLTNDHSLADEYAAEGREMPPDQQHMANMLSRWMGKEGPLPADISEVMQFPAESSLVICSDGMTKVVSEDEILHAVSLHLPEAACRKLVQLGNERGGPDNITVQVARLTRF